MDDASGDVGFGPKCLARKPCNAGSTVQTASIERSRDLSRNIAGVRAGGRTALSRRDKSLINLGMLSALNRLGEFALHVRAALRNGVTRDELQDALFQVAIYCGIPASVEAFRIASEVLTKEDTSSAEA